MAAAVVPRRPRDPDPVTRSLITIDLTREHGGLREVVALTRIRREGDTALYDASSADPQFLLDVAPFRAASVRSVRFRMRRGTRGTSVAQLFWAHAADEPFADQRSALAIVEPEPADWSEYVFRLDRAPLRERWLAGPTIARLRFDPANVAGPLWLESLEFEG